MLTLDSLIRTNVFRDHNEGIITMILEKESILFVGYETPFNRPICTNDLSQPDFFRKNVCQERSYVG